MNREEHALKKLEDAQRRYNEFNATGTSAYANTINGNYINMTRVV